MFSVRYFIDRCTFPPHHINVQQNRFRWFRRRSADDKRSQAAATRRPHSSLARFLSLLLCVQWSEAGCKSLAPQMFSAGDVVIFGRSWQIWILQVNQIPHGFHGTVKAEWKWRRSVWFVLREGRETDWYIDIRYPSAPIFSLRSFVVWSDGLQTNLLFLKSLWGSRKKMKTNDSRSPRRLFQSLVLVELAGRLWSVEDRNSYVGCAHFQFQVLTGLKRAVCLQPVGLFELVCLMLLPYWTYWFQWVPSYFQDLGDQLCYYLVKEDDLSFKNLTQVFSLSWEKAFSFFFCSLE